MVPGLDPTVDYAFKKVFGSEANKPVLLDLLFSSCIGVNCSYDNVLR